MKVGINWSGQRELTCIKELFDNRDIAVIPQPILDLN